MIEKKIISEVNRIGSLMGVNNNVLLNENRNPIAGVLEKLIPKIENSGALKNIINNKFNITSARVLGSPNASTRRLNAIKNFISTNLNLGDEGVKNIRNLIKELSEADNDFAKDVVNQFNFFKTINDKGFFDGIKKIEKDWGVNVSVLVQDKYFKSIDPNIIKPFLDRFKEKANSFFSNYKKIRARVEANLTKRNTPNLSGDEILKLEKSIKYDMDTLVGARSKYFDELMASINNRSINKDLSKKERETYSVFKNLLETIEEKTSKFGTSKKNPIPEWAIPYVSGLQAAFSFERKVINLITGTAFMQKIKRGIEFVGTVFNNGPVKEVEKAAETYKQSTTKSVFKFLFSATPRGMPPSRGIINLKSPTLYDDIIRETGKYGAWKSYATELIMRGLKYQLYIYGIEVILAVHKLGKYDDFIGNPCTQDVANQMKQKKIKSIEEYLKFITNNKSETPKCLKSYIDQENDKAVVGVLTWAEVMSNDLKQDKWMKSITDSFSDIELWKIITRLLPAYRYGEFLNTVSKPLRNYLDTGDDSELNSQIDGYRRQVSQIENELQNIDINQTPPQSQQDDSTTTQTTTQQQGGSTTTQTTINPEG